MAAADNLHRQYDKASTTEALSNFTTQPSTGSLDPIFAGTRRATLNDTSTDWSCVLSRLLQLYQKVGNEGYGKAVSELAPYFGTIDPQFVELRPGRCEIRIRNSRQVHNHLGTMHAIAMCNGAELAAGLTTDVSIPSGRRWIPIGMTVQYKAKATTDITVTCEPQQIDWTILGEIVVPVTAKDATDREILQAQITMKVSEI